MARIPFTEDDETLLMMYGNNTVSETVGALNTVKRSLTSEETELWGMLDNLIGKLKKCPPNQDIQELF